jgi:hypothetical protein
MKFFTLCIAVCCSISVSAQRNCGTSNYWQQQLSEDPVLAQRYKQINTASERRLKIIRKEQGNDIADQTVITIPVVIHILYNNAAENITDAQVQSQLNVLNKDFGKLNDDIGNLPGVFAPYAADCKIKFQLATTDPAGYATNGIVRVKTTQTGWKQDDKMKYSNNGGDDAWDARYYLNIWVCNLSRSLLGYGTFPGAAKEKDGVVIRTDVFGTIGNNSSAYNKGRTTTHEVGHWLNLKHLWGDTDCGDDNVDDTPRQKTYNTGCSSFPKITPGGCNNNPAGDMFMNFMDFSDDACIIMFTNGQKSRMRDLFSTSGARADILQSTALSKPWNEYATKDSVSLITGSIVAYPNPAITDISFRNNKGALVAPEVYAVYDIKGKLLMTGYNRSTITINRLTTGIYFIKMQYGGSQRVLRFMKQ